MVMQCQVSVNLLCPHILVNWHETEHLTLSHRESSFQDTAPLLPLACPVGPTVPERQALLLCRKSLAVTGAHRPGGEGTRLGDSVHRHSWWLAGQEPFKVETACWPFSSVTVSRGPVPLPLESEGLLLAPCRWVSVPFQTSLPSVSAGKCPPFGFDILSPTVLCSFIFFPSRYCAFLFLFVAWAIFLVDASSSVSEMPPECVGLQMLLRS